MDRRTILVKVEHAPDPDEPEGCPSVATFEQAGERFTQICVFDRGHTGPHVNSSLETDATRLTWTGGDHG
jgi:hypothetical protein